MTYDIKRRTCTHFNWRYVEVNANSEMCTMTSRGIICYMSVWAYGRYDASQLTQSNDSEYFTMGIVPEWEKHNARCISTFFTVKTRLKRANLALSYHNRASGNLQTRRMFLFDSCGRKNAKVHICMRKHQYHISCGINFLRHAHKLTHWTLNPYRAPLIAVWVVRKCQEANGHYHFCSGVTS